MQHNFALLRSILEDPDDFSRRLIYADWLEENGNPERAEFIRIQCQMEEIAQDDPRRKLLQQRESELLQQHEKDWTAFLGEYRDKPQPQTSPGISFRRGLLASVWCPLNSAEEFPDVSSWQEVQFLGFTQYEGVPGGTVVLSEPEVEKLLALPYLEALSFGNCRLTLYALAVVAMLPRLRFLYVGDLTEEGMRQLSDHLTLQIIESQWLDDGPDASGPNFPRELWGRWRHRRNKMFLQLSPKQQLREAKVFFRLQRIERTQPPITVTIEHSNFDDEDLVYLKTLPELELLRLWAVSVWGPGFQHLSSLANFTELSVGECPLQSCEGLRGLSSLRSLSITEMYSSGDEKTEGLEGLTTLESLTIGANVLGDQTLERLRDHMRLEELRLSRCTSMTDDGLAHLSNLTNLRELFLDGADNLTDEGLVHLAPLTRLEALALGQIWWQQGNITGEGLQHLQHLSRLRYLDLEQQAITDDSLTHLTTFSNLEELNLRRTNVTEEGVRELFEHLPKATILMDNAVFRRPDTGQRYVRKALDENVSFEIPANWNIEKWGKPDGFLMDPEAAGRLNRVGTLYESDDMVMSYRGHPAFQKAGLSLIRETDETEKTAEEVLLDYLATFESAPAIELEEHPQILKPKGVDISSRVYINYGQCLAVAWVHEGRPYKLVCSARDQRFAELEHVFVHVANSFRLLSD